jgi:NADH dehydrogenase
MDGAIAITGANSAAGRALLAEKREGPPLIACVRSERAEAQLGVLPPGTRVARIDYARPETLRAAFENARAVVHLPGLLVERRDASYTQANVETVAAVLEALPRERAIKLVLVSAVGADARSANRYYATKGQAEDLVRATPVESAILRAPLLLGPGTEGEAALVRELAGPRARLLNGGRQRQQPLDVRDLARAVLHAAEPGVAAGRTLDVVGPESLPYREILERTARFAGRPLRVGALPVPLGVLRLVLRLRGLVLGPGFSEDALQVIMDECVLDPRPASQALGSEPRPLDQTLRDVAERAFARST